MGTALSQLLDGTAALPKELLGRAGVADREIDIRPTPAADRRPQLLEANEVFPAQRSELACRVANVTIALLALVVMLPVPALIAVAVRLSSRGPVLYSQV